jgi:hypothetical protein
VCRLSLLNQVPRFSLTIFFFDCTHNMVEYEAMILGLNTLKYLGEKNCYTWRF